MRVRERVGCLYAHDKHEEPDREAGMGACVSIAICAQVVVIVAARAVCL